MWIVWSVECGVWIVWSVEWGVCGVCGVWSVEWMVLSKYGSGSGSGSGSEESRGSPKIRGPYSDPESQGANDPFFDPGAKQQYQGPKDEEMESLIERCRCR